MLLDEITYFSESKDLQTLTTDVNESYSIKYCF